MNRLVCIIKGIFRSIIHLYIISGHDYIEIYNNKDLQILKCEQCNHISIGWKEGEDKE